MRRLWVAALAVPALVAVVALRSEDSPASLGAAATAVVESGVPGVIVRLRDGEQVRELAKGEASVDDRFRIGSVTKTFVAALTLDVADRGILSLDETAADFEPGLVRDAADITIRELLSHRAGLFDYETDCGPVVGHTGNLLGTITVVWSGGDRLLVAAANAFPLTPDQETAFQFLLQRAFCG